MIFSKQFFKNYTDKDSVIRLIVACKEQEILEEYLLAVLDAFPEVSGFFLNIEDNCCVPEAWTALLGIDTNKLIAKVDLNYIPTVTNLEECWYFIFVLRLLYDLKRYSDFCIFFVNVFNNGDKKLVVSAFVQFFPFNEEIVDKLPITLNGEYICKKIGSLRFAIGNIAILAQANKIFYSFKLVEEIIDKLSVERYLTIRDFPLVTDQFKFIKFLLEFKIYDKYIDALVCHVVLKGRSGLNIKQIKYVFSARKYRVSDIKAMLEINSCGYLNQYRPQKCSLYAVEFIRFKEILKVLGDVDQNFCHAYYRTIFSQY